MEYSECTSKCPRTCTTLYNVMPSDCTNECYPGCRCASGTFLHNGTCKVADECPCVYRQTEHEPGSVVSVDCNTWLVLCFIKEDKNLHCQACLNMHH